MSVNEILKYTNNLNHHHIIYFTVYPYRQKDVSRTPALFSRHKHIRESAAGKRQYRPEDFQLTDSEEYKPGREFFAGMTG